MSPRPRFAALAPEKSRAILHAAAREISERGIEGASYNRIIERAGVSKGAMYYYFDDQWDLYETVLRSAAERAAAAIGELAAFDDAHSFWDALFELYERVTAFFVSEPEVADLLKALLAKPLSAAAGEAGAGALIAEYMQRLEVAFGAILEQGVAVGAVRDDVPLSLLSKLAFALGEVMDRWTLAQWSSITPAELERIPGAMLLMQMRVLAPLSLVLERESGAAPRRRLP